MLGGDDDHAIGCTRAVEGGGSGVLEDCDRFDVVRVDGCQDVAGVVVFVGQLGIFLVAQCLFLNKVDT